MAFQRDPSRFAKDISGVEPQGLEDLRWQLTMLSGFLNDFATALALFDENLDEIRSGKPSLATAARMRLAARDGAHTIYNFAEVLDAISFRRAPKLSAAVDTKGIKHARHTFNAFFKTFRDMRNAVAHSGEEHSKPASRSSHAASAPITIPGFLDARGGKVQIVNSLQGRTFMSTWKGKVVSYDVSPEALSKLHEVTNIVFDAVGVAP